MMDDKQRFAKANECAATSEGQLNNYGVPEIMDCLACNKGVKIFNFNVDEVVSEFLVCLDDNPKRDPEFAK